MIDIRRLRKMQGISQVELAKAVGISQSVLSKYESGLVTPPADRYEAICEYLNAKLILVGEKITKKALYEYYDKHRFDSPPSTDPLEAANLQMNRFYVERSVVFAAQGYCELCKSPAPFKDKQGYPYLMPFIVKELQKSYVPTEKEIVALCPNCYQKMEINPSDEDIAMVKKTALSHSFR